QNSLFLVHHSISSFLVPCSLFNFSIPCSLFIIQIKLNSQARGQIVSSLARHEREHRLWGYAQGNYNF
ncbi:MAG: hypothetical protein ACK5HE_01495, partial [Bacteroidota bacterium]